MRPDEFLKAIHPNFNDPPVWQNEFLLELMFWVIAVLLALVLLRIKPSLFNKIENFGTQVGRRRGLACVTIIFCSLALRVAVLPLLPIPEPQLHDEFSFLMQADTFAQGRITNDTPKGWEHFETFHENMVPHYQSMYPPGQALVLATARVLHLNAWWAVWMSVGIMCGLVCWMLQGWLPPQWALLGGLFCVIRFSIFSYWMESYFGGAVGAIGGALVMGALPRLRRSWSPLIGVVFALGLGVIANTRAYEGFVFSIPAIVAVLWWFISALKQHKVKILALAPGVVLLLVVAVAMGYYNLRNTGHITDPPYMLNQRMYHLTKPFIWQDSYPMPAYRHKIMRIFYAFHEMPDYYRRRMIPGFIWTMFRERFEVYYDFFVWPLLIPSLFAMLYLLKKPKLRILAITVLFVLVAVLIEQWPPEGHYGAPVLGTVIAVVIYGLRRLRVWKLYGKPFGMALARSAVVCVLAWTCVQTAYTLIDPWDLGQQAQFHHFWLPSQMERARIQNQLEGTPGKHIVFVRFHRGDFAGIFWIFNDADVANSKVIWAYDMGDEQNEEFTKMYPGRKSWLIDKNDTIMPLIPYFPDQRPSSRLIGPSSID